MSDKMEERGFLDGNQDNSWLPLKNEAGYRFRDHTMRSTGDGPCPAQRSDVLWTVSRIRKIHSFVVQCPWAPPEYGRCCTMAAACYISHHTSS